MTAREAERFLLRVGATVNFKPRSGNQTACVTVALHNPPTGYTPRLGRGPTLAAATARARRNADGRPVRAADNKPVVLGDDDGIHAPPRLDTTVRKLYAAPLSDAQLAKCRERGRSMRACSQKDR